MLFVEKATDFFVLAKDFLAIHRNPDPAGKTSKFPPQWPRWIKNCPLLTLFFDSNKMLSFNPKKGRQNRQFRHEINLHGLFVDIGIKCILCANFAEILPGGKINLLKKHYLTIKHRHWSYFRGIISVSGKRAFCKVCRRLKS